MKWKSKNHSVTPPTPLVTRRKMEVRVDGEIYNVEWLPDRRSLQVYDDQGVERRIRIRSRVCKRATDPSQHTAMLELIAGEKSVQSHEFNLSPDVPGQEARAAAAAAAGAVMRSQLTGKVLKVMVAEGAQVRAGDTVVIIEAMKMENKVLSPIDGTLKGLKVTEGQAVTSGAEICKISVSDA